MAAGALLIRRDSRCAVLREPAGAPRPPGQGRAARGRITASPSACSPPRSRLPSACTWKGGTPPRFITPAPTTFGLRTTEATYPGGTEHIRAVRADLRAVLDDCPRADDVILCASELAANAAQHSRSRLPGGTFTVRATVSADHYARIEVQDNGGPWMQATIDSARHHGLDIIRAIADAWGSDGGHATRTIWARFDWPA